MQKPRKWLLYSGYVLALTAVCLYYLFPAETVSRFLRGRVSGAIPGCRLSFGSVKPVFPPGLELEEIAVTRGDQAFFNIDRVSVSPGFLSLFSEKPPLFVKSEACGGIIDGRVLLDSWVNGRPSRVRLNLKGIALERIAWLQTTAKRKISGTLAGKLLYDRKSPRETLRAGFKLTGLAIELRGPVFNMAALVFKTVDTDMVVNSQQLLVKRCVLAGEKVDGTLTGSLSLKSPAEKSVLQFSGVIKFHPDFRDHLEKKGLGTLLPKKKAGRKGGYPIQIFGTLDNPRFSLK